MALRGLLRLFSGRRLSAASRAGEGLLAVAGGRPRAAARLLVIAALSYRWRAAGIAFELARRLWRRAR